MMEAPAILTLQPGISRLVDGLRREPVPHRGHGGCRAHDDHWCHEGHVNVLRVRHQRGAGCKLEETWSEGPRRRQHLLRRHLRYGICGTCKLRKWVGYQIDTQGPARDLRYLPAI